MSAAETLAVTVPWNCEYLFHTKRHICTECCFPALLPYVLNVSFAMDEDSLAVSSEKEPGMC